MSMTLEVYKVPTGQTWVTLRCNPSRLADPDGWRLVTIVPALQYLSAAWSMTLSSWSRAADCLPLRFRAWTSRDFNGILLPSRYVRSLADAPSDTRGGIRGYSKAFRVRGDSLYWGNKSGQARLYDKHLETRGRAAHGTLRWEVESRRPWCVEHGIRVVHDITPASVVHLARNIWRRSGMGTPVTSLPQFVKDVMTDPKVSDTEVRGLLGWLLAESYGANIAPKGKDTMKKYRDIVGRHGVPTLFQECNHDGWPVHGRLDLDTGEEVLHAAL